MAERLTRNSKVNFYFHDEASNMVYYKLQDLEDIMEKYGIEDLEQLDIMLFCLSGETKFQLKQLQKLYKKYKIKNVEELDKKIGHYIDKIDLEAENDYLKKAIEKQNKVTQSISKDRDTWQKACELACQIIISGYCDGMEDTTDWEDAVYQWKEDNSIETYGIGVEELLEYLLEQAKTEGNDE